MKNKENFDFLSKAVEEANKKLCEKYGVAYYPPSSEEDEKKDREETIPDITLEFYLD